MFQTFLSFEKIPHHYFIKLKNPHKEREGPSVRTLKRYLSSYREAESEMEQKGEEGLVSRAGTGYIHRNDNKLLEICHPKDPEWVLDVIPIRMKKEYISICNF